MNPRFTAHRTVSLAMALAAALAAGCDESALESRPADGGVDRADDGRDPAPTPPTAFLSVVYDSSLRPGPYLGALSGLADNDLFKFAENTALLRIRPPDGQRVTHLRVHRGEALLHAQAVEGEGIVELSVALDTAAWPEGVHPLRYVATTDADEEIVGEEEVRVYFNVTAIAADPDDPHLLWLGTVDTGLLAYHLGDDPLDPADDAYRTYGGHLFEPADARPPRGRPWQGVGGYYNQREPAGQLVLDVAHAQGGVFVGAAWRGVSYLDHRGTPFDRGDDRYALFHPGMNLEPETTEAGLANCVSAIVPDGEQGLWFGTFAGLFHVDHRGTLSHDADDIWTVFAADGRYDPNIMRLVVDDGGRVWIASFDTDGGHAGNTLTVLDPGGTPADTGDDVWARLALPEGFPAEASALAVDGHRIYIGTSNGLYVLDHGDTPTDPADDVWLRLGREDGLLDDDIGALAVRPDGQLWVGAYDVCGGEGGGLMLIDPDGCARDGACAPRVSYTVADGLLDDDISSLHLLPDGGVALGTFNLFAAPVLGAVFDVPGGDDCVDDDPERNLGPMVGRDGLSIIDPGADAADKGDDGLVNL